MRYNHLLLLTTLFPGINAWADHDGTVHQGEDMIITSSHKLFPNTTVATPSFNVSKEDIDKTNLTSAEDAIRMAPSVHVRRRFYGDTNGVTAIRGSTNFQTNHFNMYVDGLPLHNPVQTKWNGAPKWNLIAPNAIDSTTVFYGPYSAEHRGAFGGTFDLKTQLPDDFEMHMDATGIIQEVHRFGKEEVLTGHKEFISAGDRFGKWSIFGFYNHLENEGQAQSFAVTDSPATGTGGTAVYGGHHSKTITGANRIVTGDFGINENITDLYEVKVGYDFTEDLRGLFTIALEDTERNSQARTYLRDTNGNKVWDGTVNQDGLEFSANPTSFGWPNLSGSENERKTLAYGLNLSGKVTEDWSIDTTASFFDAFKDSTYESKRSQNDPRYKSDKSGRIKDIEVWWVDYSLKLATQNLFGRDDLGFMSGYQYNYSYLDINQYNSGNVADGTRDTLRDADGGSTQTHSAFMQADWDIIDQINIMAGLRFDHWSTFRGHLNDCAGCNGRTQVADRELSRVSPKASVSFTPVDNLNFRYSFSKAYRFPVAEELFDSSSNTNAANLADPTLKPESGFFHDFKVQYDLDDGYVSATLFYNTIENEIMNTRTLQNNGTIANRTRGIDETETIGVEFVYQQNYIMGTPFDLNLNGTWINKEIKKDNNTPTNEGNEWVRIPQWRANGTATYHVTPDWDAIAAVQYRSKQFGQDDNSDKNWHVYGASDDYVLVNVKTAYKMNVGHGVKAKFSVGIDNLLDENYYDHHPYPQRTYFANISLDI